MKNDELLIELSTEKMFHFEKLMTEEDLMNCPFEVNFKRRWRQWNENDQLTKNRHWLSFEVGNQ